MKWIGLTGGIASGKSTVAELIRGRGFFVVDADQLAREVVEKGSVGLQSIVNEFGPVILQPDGSLDRKKLGNQVFGHPERLEKLEVLLHPQIQERTARIRKTLTEQGAAIAFYDVPLLYEKQLEAQFDAVILVTTDLATQKMRMRNRDGLSDQEIEKRLSAQIPLEEKEKRAHYVIKNQGSLKELEDQVVSLIQKIQSGKA